ncbi:MAG: hypothetical protein EBS53_15135, partial [Bacteroidetes bacterium]|nr:hypothetical protein [Bacteroidota bacterium]
ITKVVFNNYVTTIRPKTSAGYIRLNKLVSPSVYTGINRMKKIFILVLFAGLTTFIPGAQAASYYWDTTAGAGNGVGGTGNLTTTSTTWSVDPLGSASLTAGTWTTSGAMGLNDTMVFQGTAGAVSLGGSTSSQGIQVNATGYTFTNSSPTSNRYLGATNGITLADGVNLNLSGGVAASSGAGILGLRMSGIQAAAGAANTSITVTGDNGSVTGSGIRIGFTTNGVPTNASSYSTSFKTNVIGVNTVVNTTGAGYTYFHVSDSSTSVRFDGSLTISNGSKLILSPGTSGSRVLEVRGNIMTYADGALSIGESVNLGLVNLSGSNTLTGNLNVYGQLGYGSTNAFGSAKLLLNQGATLGQSAGIGDGTDGARGIANNILLNGGAWTAGTYVTFGGLGYGNVLNGTVDLNGQSRLLRFDNATTLNGGFINSTSGLTLTNNSTSSGGRTLNLNGASTYSGDTTFVSSGTGWKVTVGNTNGSAFGSGDVIFNRGTNDAGVNSVLAGTGTITGKIKGNGQISAGSGSVSGGGLLTVGGLDPTSNQAYAFELTAKSMVNGLSYNNDVIRSTLPGGPFTANLTSANIVDIGFCVG